MEIITLLLVVLVFLVILSGFIALIHSLHKLNVDNCECPEKLSVDASTIENPKEFIMALAIDQKFKSSKFTDEEIISDDLSYFLWLMEFNIWLYPNQNMLYTYKCTEENIISEYLNHKIF